jgi:hypothetical protein
MFKKQPDAPILPITDKPKGQTRREAGTQSQRSRFFEMAQLPAHNHFQRSALEAHSEVGPLKTRLIRLGFAALVIASFVETLGAGWKWY